MDPKNESTITAVLLKIKHGGDVLYRSKTKDDVAFVTEVKPVVVATEDDTPPSSGGWSGGGGSSGSGGHHHH